MGLPTLLLNKPVDFLCVFIQCQEEVLKELTKKKETLEASIKRRNNLLSNENYVKKAPSNIVEKERLDLQKETDMLNNVLKEIENLG